MPYALRHIVEGELEQQQKEGIIAPVQFADWAAPIVPVMKSDQKSVTDLQRFQADSQSSLQAGPISHTPNTGPLCNIVRWYIFFQVGYEPGIPTDRTGGRLTEICHN